jgi:hypothetical protein
MAGEFARQVKLPFLLEQAFSLRPAASDMALDLCTWLAMRLILCGRPFGLEGAPCLGLKNLGIDQSISRPRSV